MLEVRDLVATYGPVTALDGVSLTVPAGQITAVLGANGAGKTTLLRTVSGLVRPKAGSVHLEGQDITRVAVEQMVRRGMAHVPEGRGVIAELTIEENLRLGALVVKGGDQEAEIEGIYKTFPPLDERRKRSAHTLSGGERQMLVVGRALLSRPKVLLLDEPSLGLAPRIVAQIKDIVVQINERGTTVLLVEQNVRLGLGLATHGVVMEGGKVRLTGTAAEVKDHPEMASLYLGGSAPATK